MFPWLKKLFLRDSHKDDNNPIASIHYTEKGGKNKKMYPARRLHQYDEFMTSLKQFLREGIITYDIRTSFGEKQIHIYVCDISRKARVTHAIAGTQFDVEDTLRYVRT